MIMIKDYYNDDDNDEILKLNLIDLLNDNLTNRLNKQQVFISVRSLPLYRKQPSFLEEMKLYCMPLFSARLAHYSPFLVGILFTK